MQDDQDQKMSYFYKFNHVRVNERLFQVPLGLLFLKNNFIYYLYDEVIQGLTTAGISQHLWKIYKYDKYSVDREPLTKSPSILTLNDLSYGFIIWLVACGLAACVFIGEHAWPKNFSIKKTLSEWLRNIIGLILVIKMLEKFLKAPRM